MNTSSPVLALSREHLMGLVSNAVASHGPLCDLNHIDVSGVADLTEVFRNSTFDGDISKWDVSNARSMESMFRNARFNGNISQWDTGAVMDTSYMFQDSHFNGDIANWDVSHVEFMTGMFSASAFRGDISGWDVTRVRDFRMMFQYTSYQSDLSTWNWNEHALLSVMFDDPIVAPVCMYHWYMALQCNDPSILTPQANAFYETHREVVASLCDGPPQMVRMFNTMWLNHCRAPTLQTIALPSLD